MSIEMKSYAELVADASKAAHDYLQNAVNSIDEVLGKGAARKNPELVAAMVRAASVNYFASMLPHDMAPALHGVANAIRGVGEAFAAKQLS